MLQSQVSKWRIIISTSLPWERVSFLIHSKAFPILPNNMQITTIHLQFVNAINLSQKLCFLLFKPRLLFSTFFWLNPRVWCLAFLLFNPLLEEGCQILSAIMYFLIKKFVCHLRGGTKSSIKSHYYCYMKTITIIGYWVLASDKASKLNTF